MGAAECWRPAPQPPRPVASSEGCEFAEDLPDDVEVWLLWAFDGVDVGFCSQRRRSERQRRGMGKPRQWSWPMMTVSSAMKLGKVVIWWRRRWNWEVKMLMRAPVLTEEWYHMKCVREMPWKAGCARLP